MKPFVYIASPYTKGDQAINTHVQCRIFDSLMDDDVVWPFIPLLTHFQHIVFPRSYQDWINYDLEILKRFDACLRINSTMVSLDYYVSESSGADGEVAAFLDMNKPVFYDIDSCYEWAREL